MQGSKNFHPQQTFLTMRKASFAVLVTCLHRQPPVQPQIMENFRAFQLILPIKLSNRSAFGTSYLQLQHPLLLIRIWKIFINSHTYQLQFYAVYHKYLQHYVDYFIFNKNYFYPLIIKCIFPRRDCNKLKYTYICVNSGFHFLTRVRIVSLLI